MTGVPLPAGLRRGTSRLSRWTARGSGAPLAGLLFAGVSLVSLPLAYGQGVPGAVAAAVAPSAASQPVSAGKVAAAAPRGNVGPAPGAASGVTTGGATKAAAPAADPANAPSSGEPEADALAAARRLIATGAFELALARIDRSQRAGAPRWYEWELLRLAVLTELGRSREIVALAEALAIDGTEARAAPGFVREWWQAGAEASLRIGAPERARTLAARLIWSTSPGAEALRRARQLVIDSYFAQGEPVAGYLAMLRYRQDHPTPDPAATARLVALLVEAGRGTDALPWLLELDSAHPVRLAAQARLGLMPPSSAAAQARGAVDRRLPPRLLSLMRALGESAGDGLLMVQSTELRLAQPVLPADSPGPADLLRDYAAALAAVANREQLLVGDDAGWADAAARIATRDPVAARVLFARLALHGNDARVRDSARLQLASLLREAGLALAAVRLFDHRDRFAVHGAGPDALSADLRRQLGRLAASYHQYPLAADYWRDLPASPLQDPDLWAMDRADVLARSGQVDAAAQTVAAILTLGRAAPGPEVITRARALAALLADAGASGAAAAIRTATDGRLLGSGSIRQEEKTDGFPRK